MSLQFHNKRECPPGMFRFHVRETGKWIDGMDWNQFVNNVKAHYRANDLPIGLLFEDMLENQACMNTDPSACHQVGYGNVRPTRTLTTYEQFKGALGIMWDMVKSVGKLESVAEVKRRSVICIGCDFNQQPVGCPTCGGDKLRGLIAKFVNNEPTEYDGRLRACRMCGCSLEAKVRIPLKILKENEPAFMEENYPPWCWLKTQTQ